MASNPFRINKSRLDFELFRQADLMFQHMTSLANAKLAVETAKNKVSVSVSTADRDLRSSYEAGKKPPEDAIKNAVACSAIVQAATDELIHAKHASDIAQAAVSALDNKRSALSNLVTLHGQAYFATPRPKGKGAEELAERKKRRVRTRRRRSETSEERKTTDGDQTEANEASDEEEETPRRKKKKRTRPREET